MAGLKREAGVNPAWSRHCNWRELLYSSLPEATGPIRRAGKAEKVRQQPEARRPALRLGLDTLRGKVYGVFGLFSLTKKVRLFCV